jgi:hypothetical protein
MPHPLEDEYGLSADELLDAINRRFRAKVTLEGAVAEVHLRKYIQDAVASGQLERFEEHDQDGYPDFSIWLPGVGEPLRVECKNVRNSEQAYRSKGQVVAYKVETQKTRTSNNDKSSRFYGFDEFEVLAVCLGKKTHAWKQFVFVHVSHLSVHEKYLGKMAVMHAVPLPETIDIAPWARSLGELLARESL